MANDNCYQCGGLGCDWCEPPPDRPKPERTVGKHPALGMGYEPQCRCGMRAKLVGDGCQVCNPELYAELTQENDDEP